MNIYILFWVLWVICKRLCHHPISAHFRYGRRYRTRTSTHHLHTLHIYSMQTWSLIPHTINNMQNDKEMYQIVWLLFAFHYPNQIFSLCLYQRPNFQRILRKRLGLTWDWPEVLSMAPIVQLLKIWVWPELFSLSLLRVSLVISNEREEAFFWPIAVSELRCDTQRIMRLNRAGQPGARAQVEKDLRLHMYFCRKGLKNPSSGPT